MAKDPNEGARLLRLAIETKNLTHKEVRAQIGGGSISRYLSGERHPERTVALALLRAFEIPVDAWDLPVTSKRASGHADRIASGLAVVSTQKSAQVSR
jgi:hypothetical protein